MKKSFIALAALLSVFFFSCENDESSVTNHDSAKVNLQYKQVLMDYCKNISSQGVNSKMDLTKAIRVSGVENQELKEKSVFLYFLEGQEPNYQQNYAKDPFGTPTHGWWYSESTGCLIYGTYYTWPSGIRLFYPASAATQALMNDCTSAQNVA